MTDFSLKEIESLIIDSLYSPKTDNLFLSRCFDDFNWQQSEDKILSLPGGDLGELALVLATANNFAFEVDYQKAYQVLVDLVGGKKNFSFCTSDLCFAKKDHFTCCHWQNIFKHPKDYHLNQQDLDFLSRLIKKNKKLVRSLTDEIKKTAIVIIKGDQAVYPVIEVLKGNQTIKLGFFVYQKTLANQRYQLLAKKLIEKKAVNLYPGCDWQYLYQVITDEADNHLWSTLTKIAKNLPVFQVEATKPDKLKINYLETVK